MTDLVVFGAGPAGLAAAYRAARTGREVVVLERESVVGGAARSIDVAGVRCDLGSHRLHRTIDPAILDCLAGLLGDDLQRRERHGRIRLAGRWLPFPLRPTSTLRGLPPGFALRAARDAVVAPLRRSRTDTFDEVVRAGLGPTMADRFYGPYARKLWGCEPSELSGEQARRRINAGSSGAILRRILRGADPASRTFLYPRRGFGQLWEALADAAVEAGVDLRLDARITGVETGSDGVEAIADGRRVAARRAWSTLPLPVLAHLHRPRPPREVLEAAASLRSRAMLLIYVVLPVPRWSSYDAHYLPEDWTPITRISEPKNYRDGHPGATDSGDPTDRTVLCAELPCDRGDVWWEASDDELGAWVVAAIEGAGSACPPPVEVVTHRLPSAYPVYQVGYEPHLRVLDEWAAGRPNLLTFGRQGLFVHDNSHHALAMAWAAADALADDGFDRGAWARARERFATHVVED